MAWPIPTPAAVDTMLDSMPPPWETGAGGCAAEGLALAGGAGWAVRAGTLDVVEAERVWVGREGAGAGREGAGRPPRCLWLLVERGDWGYRHDWDGLLGIAWMSE